MTENFMYMKMKCIEIKEKWNRNFHNTRKAVKSANWSYIT